MVPSLAVSDCQSIIRVNPLLVLGFFVTMMVERGSPKAPMNFTFDGFQCGILIVSISFQYLLVTYEEILPKMQQVYFL